MRHTRPLLTLPLLLALAPSRALAQEPPHDNPDNSALAKDNHPLAGWHNGLAYLRDPNDNFRLYLQGRAQIDAYAWSGPAIDNVTGAGTPNPTMKPTIFLKRIRPEITGEVINMFTYMIAGDFGQSNVDNPDAKSTETSAAAPGGVPSATSGRYAAGDSVRFQAQATDVYVGGYWLNGLLNFQMGQYDAPFTMENRTSDKYFPFIERSMAVRAVGIPTNKEIGLMLWGEDKKKLLFYSIGGFDGKGQNRPNIDGRGEVIGRFVSHPLGFLGKSGMGLEDSQIGMSFRYGSRDPKTVLYDYPNLTTQGGYAFWKSTYKGDGGTNVHILPSGDQLGLAWELRVPIKMFDLTSEFVYIDNNTREAVEGFQATNTDRLGHIFGYSTYIQLGAWPLGNRDINGKPGYEAFPHVDFSKPDPVEPKQALQVLARYELVNLTYNSSNRADSKGVQAPSGLTNIDGNIVAHGLQFGANYWFTKHIRISANYEWYTFPDSAPIGATPAANEPGGMAGPTWSNKNRAQAPGNTIGTDNPGRDNAHDLHEFSMRFAVAL